MQVFDFHSKRCYINQYILYTLNLKKFNITNRETGE